QIQLMETIRGLGRTVVAAVHDLTLAAAHFDQVAVLHEGSLLTAGSPAAVLDPSTLRQVFDVEATHLTDPVTGRVHLVLGTGALPATDRRKAVS
ncbi:MAG TPA: ABC transporter ATP-binding protein, partial [Candidatus Janibacter merdipullorum]|nr:ABC transporter ATP-binding protein [Candidatus Janibacter merdipullorum]